MQVEEIPVNFHSSFHFLNFFFKELKGVLDSIKDLFEDISVFCTKLAKGDSNPMSGLVGRFIRKYSEYNKKFKEFNSALIELDCHLSKCVGVSKPRLDTNFICGNMCYCW